MLAYLEQIVLKHELYFSSPSQLKDPLDTRPRFIVTSRGDALPRIVNPFLAQHAHDPLDRLAEDVRNMIKMVRTAPLDKLADALAVSFHEQMADHRIYSMTTRRDN